MPKLKTIDSFFKRKEVEDTANNTTSGVNASSSSAEPPSNPQNTEEHQLENLGHDFNDVDIATIERDPGKRLKMWEYPPNKRDEIRRAYLKLGPYQIHLTEYPKSGKKHPRRFQESWYTQFSSWLEYSPFEDAAYCLPCYLFTMKAACRPGWDVFSVKGFRNWKKVNDGNRCAFLNHIGEGSCSPHNKAVQACEDLLKQSRHIDKVINMQTRAQIVNNRLRVKTSIDAIRFLAVQGCAFRGHDETPESQNQGNFVELIKLLASYNEKVAQTVLENAPKSAKYTSPAIQKEILQVIASKVRKKIREDVLNINVVVSSCKRHDELQDAQIEEIAHLLSIDELESGKGANQIGTLKRPSDTRWSSYFLSLCSLVRLFGPTIAVLEKIEKESSNYCQRGDANAACKMVTSFEFIFILHLMKEIMGITNGLCQALQQKNQDILNAMHLVSDTKALIQKFREDGWENFLGKVISFSNKYEIDIPDLNAPYFEGRSRRRKRDVTLEHHFHVDIFVAAIDVQLQELNCRFGESAMELLTLSSALEPKNAYKSFNIETICLLVEKYYPLDFTEQEKINLRFQLRSFEIDVHSHPELQSLSSIPQLCRRLVETERVSRYYLIDRLIRLILTLPVSTATGERAFSAMKIIKTRLRNKMEDDFLADNLAVYIEREIAKSFNSDSILDGFSSIKERRVLFK